MGKRRLTWTWLPPIGFGLCLALVWLFGLDGELFYGLNGASRVTGQTVWANLTSLGDGLVLMVLVRLPYYE